MLAGPAFGAVRQTPGRQTARSANRPVGRLAQLRRYPLGWHLAHVVSEKLFTPECVDVIDLLEWHLAHV